MKATKIGLILLILTPNLFGDTRGSEDYGMTTESSSSGTPQASGGDIVLDGSLDPASGAVATSTDFTLKRGYVGQLYDVAQITIGADPSALPEGSDSQLDAEAILDDGTSLSLLPTEVIWDGIPRSLLSIDAAGLARSANIFQDEIVLTEATYQGITGQLSLSILNTDPDNYSSYGADGIDDFWQVENFGAPPNADAGPTKNPDKDPYDNTFESLTGSDPNDGADFLRFDILDRDGAAATLRLSKVIPGTRYRIRRSDDLGRTDAFSEFTGSVFTVPDEESDFDLFDPGASADSAFYILGVEPE
jgi:hypothetical protein